MKIGIAKYPYIKNTLKGGDQVLFHSIYESLSEYHEVSYIEYNRNYISYFDILPKFFYDKFNKFFELFLPIIYTYQIEKYLHNYDVVIADSSVITDIGSLRNVNKIYSLVNIDYYEYYHSLKNRIGFFQRINLIWKYFLQSRGLRTSNVIAVSKFSGYTITKNSRVPNLILENRIPILLPPHDNHSKFEIVYAGSGDWWGKGLDIVSKLASTGLSIHSYSTRAIPHCINNAPLPREQLLKQLANYKILILPSRYESFGLIAIESMMLGIPVVMRKTGLGFQLKNSIPECIVNTDDVVEWKNTIEYILNNYNEFSTKVKVFATDFMKESNFHTDWNNVFLFE